jgi:hypothetical protein
MVAAETAWADVPPPWKLGRLPAFGLAAGPIFAFSGYPADNPSNLSPAIGDIRNNREKYATERRSSLAALTLQLAEA